MASTQTTSVVESESPMELAEMAPMSAVAPPMDSAESVIPTDLTGSMHEGVDAKDIALTPHTVMPIGEIDLENGQGGSVPGPNAIANGKANQEMSWINEGSCISEIKRKITKKHVYIASRIVAALVDIIMIASSTDIGCFYDGAKWSVYAVNIIAMFLLITLNCCCCCGATATKISVYLLRLAAFVRSLIFAIVFVVSMVQGCKDLSKYLKFNAGFFLATLLATLEPCLGIAYYEDSL